MSFWDSSALVPLVLQESQSKFLREWSKETGGSLNVWWCSLVECHSAIYRRNRSGELDEIKLRRASNSLASLVESWDEIIPDESIRNEALRLLRLYPLRAGDALQLAAAIIWSNYLPAGKPFVCLDDRIRKAAQIEGFHLIPEELVSEESEN